jgi:hypothetical protein
MQDIMCVAFVLDRAADIRKGAGAEEDSAGVAARVVCGTESGAVFVFQTVEEPREDDPDEFLQKNKGVDDEEDEMVVKPVNWACRYVQPDRARPRPN